MIAIRSKGKHTIEISDASFRGVEYINTCLALHNLRRSNEYRPLDWNNSCNQPPKINSVSAKLRVGKVVTVDNHFSLARPPSSPSSPPTHPNFFDKSVKAGRIIVENKPIDCESRRSAAKCHVATHQTQCCHITPVNLTYFSPYNEIKIIFVSDIKVSHCHVNAVNRSVKVI